MWGKIISRNLMMTCCLPEIKLQGRQIISPETLKSAEVSSLLWTALELHEMYSEVGIFIDSPISKASVTFLMSKHNTMLESIVQAASHIMDTKISIIVDDWENMPHPSDYGEFLSRTTDLVLTYTKKYSKLEQFIKGLHDVPMLSIESCRYKIPRTLSDIMTIYLQYGYVKTMNLGWLGGPTKLLNTYLCIMPSLGVNIRYCNACKDENCMSPVTLPFALNLSKQQDTELKEYIDHKEMLKKSEVIGLSPYCAKEMALTQSLANEVLPQNWAFFYSVPRDREYVDDSIVNLNNNIVWSCVDNFKWILAAFMIRLLRSYQHVTCPPEFQNCPLKNRKKPTENDVTKP